MKKIILLLLVLLSGCGPTPEFEINGKQYYTRKNCTSSHEETKWEYHWGFNWIGGEYEWHFGPNTKTICDVYQIDTIQIIKK